MMGALRNNFLKIATFWFIWCTAPHLYMSFPNLCSRSFYLSPTGAVPSLRVLPQTFLGKI